MTDVVEVAHFRSGIDADLARTYLESYGLQSIVFDDNAARYFAAWGVRLMVLESDLDEARMLLQQYFKEDEQSDRRRSQRDSISR